MKERDEEEEEDEPGEGEVDDADNFKNIFRVIPNPGTGIG